jgi:SAM-dependent methyltransferase
MIDRQLVLPPGRVQNRFLSGSISLVSGKKYEVSLMLKAEAERLHAEYERREEDIPTDFYALTQPVNLFFHQQRARTLLDLLHCVDMIPLKGKKILDIGCGTGQHLLDLESWGARREDLAGIDLIESRALCARARLCTPATETRSGADIRVGDASTLPWPDTMFDLVHQSTLFTSILDETMRKTVAAEMLRVLKPNGVILWYDFLFNNPKNPHVRGIGAREINVLFPGCSIRLKRVTLAPPIARRLVPVTWIGALLLEKIRVLNTHYLGIIRRLEGRL